MAKKLKIPMWVWIAVALVVATVIGIRMMPEAALASMSCPKSQVYCPGVGCVSGQDKCFPGSRGGASSVFSKETFAEWPGAGVRAIPPIYEAVKEAFTVKKCKDMQGKLFEPCILR